MKRFLALTLAVTLVLSLFSACGGSNGNNGTANSGANTSTSTGDTSSNTADTGTSTADTSSDTAAASGNEDVAADLVAEYLLPNGLINGLEGDLVFAGAARQFNVSDPNMGGAYDYFSANYPNFRVLGYDRENEGNAIGQLQELIAAGNPPDVFISTSGDIPNVVRNEYALPLNDYLQQYPEYAASLIPAATELNAVDGKIYGICWELLPRAWLINVDLFDRLGITLPSSDWTVDEFVEINKKLANKDDGISGVQGDLHVLVEQFLMAYQVQAAKEVDGKIYSAYAEDPNAIKACEAAYQVLYGTDSQFTDEEKNSFGPNWNSYWTEGHVAMVPWSLWGQPYNPETGRNYFNWAVLPPPTGPGGHRGGNSDSIVMCIFPTSAKADLAFKYIMANTTQHYVDNASVINMGSTPPEVSPAGFRPDEMKFPVGLPPINMQFTTHPDNVAALDGFMTAAAAMRQSPYGIVGLPNNDIVNEVVPGNMSIADMLKAYDNRRNSELGN